MYRKFNFGVKWEFWRFKFQHYIRIGSFQLIDENRAKVAYTINVVGKEEETIIEYPFDRIDIKINFDCKEYDVNLKVPKYSQIKLRDAREDSLKDKQ